MARNWLAIVSFAVAVSGVACRGPKAAEAPPPAANSIGAAGGTASLPGGPSLTIPPGALTAETIITVAQAATPAPAGALSPIYRFDPEGTTFAKPALVTFPVPVGTTSGSVYWTKAGSTTEYEPLEGTFDGDSVTALVTHFSQGFVGARCSVGMACTPSNACHTGTISCGTGTPICADSNLNVSDGARCGGDNVCSSGLCVAACAPNVSCTPSNLPDPCKTYSTSCTSSSAAASCLVAGNQVDGTNCGPDKVCHSGSCLAACISNTSCTPPGAASACKVYATRCASITAPPTCGIAGNQADGTTCGGVDVCSSGSCVPACVSNAACTPTGLADRCKAYSTTCASSTAAAICDVAGNQADGTSCGGLNACASGSCVPRPTRTVSGTLQALYERDDGSTTLVRGSLSQSNPFSVTGILVIDDSPGGYALFPVSMDANFHFSVPNVPVGHYFLQVDNVSYTISSPQIQVVARVLYEMTSDAPDLTAVVHGRSDRVAASEGTFVTVNLSDGVPWTSGDSVIISTSQGEADVRPPFNPPVSSGATTVSSKFEWLTMGLFNTFLPDASKGDVTYVDHRAAISVKSTTGAGVGTWRYAAEFAKLVDFSLLDGSAENVLTATLSPAPQTGTLPGEFRSSDFAALAGAVNPAASPYPGSVSIHAVAGSLDSFSFDFGSITSMGFLTLQNAGSNVDFGTLHYGQFLDPVWHDVVSIAYDYGAPLHAPVNSTPLTVSETYFSYIPRGSLPTSYVPTLSPPTDPRINGANAFSATSVGAAPIISWSPPTLGTATHYTVLISCVNDPAVGDVTSLKAVVYSSHSFQVPHAFLKTGDSYSASITAVNSPEVLDSPPFRQGFPYTTIGTDFGLFGP